MRGRQWITDFRKRPPAHQCLFGSFGVVYRYRRRYCCMKQARDLGYSWAVVLAPRQGGRQEQDAALIELLDTLNIEKSMFWEPLPEEHPLCVSPLMTQNVPQALFFSAPPPSGIKSRKSCRACGTCLCSKPQLPNMTASPLLSTDLWAAFKHDLRDAPAAWTEGRNRY